MFLANENFPRPSISLLRENDFDVLSIQEVSPGISDESVFNLAKDKNLIVLTFDRDYGEMIFRYSLEDPPAVIFFRDKGQNPSFAGEVLVRLLRDSEIDFKDAFTVIEHLSIRQRFYNNNS